MAFMKNKEFWFVWW